ncbi:uncharacterized protein [Gossypium hirsutum]|uniref:G-patch domain-containing protein n=1 Tax=Gossypium hirsutum TaxID=3635 RepID=A0ABM2ZPX0_GOSHI|nr:uncharacterized protein LOC107921702 [Gossypium hirsutum]
MDQRLEQFQKEMQDQLQQKMNEQLENIQQKMMDKMMESQGNMMTKLTQLLTGGVDKGKSSVLNVEEGDSEGPVYPPGFTPQQVKVYPHKSSVTIKPQQFQAGTTTPMNLQAGSENATRNGKIDVGESSRRSASKKKENEVNNASYSKMITVNQPRNVAVDKQGADTRQNKEKSQFTPIPMSYKELYQRLFNAHVVSPFYLEPLQPPYPKWYNANAQCDYQAGIVGHSIEHCMAFKKLVERLIGLSVVKLDDSPKTENPLPDHNGVNMIGGSMGRRIKEDVAEVKIPLRWVWRKMVERRLFVLDSERSFEGVENYCEFHHGEGHEIQECTEFRALVQGMMDYKEMEFYEEVKEEGSICTSESTKVPRVVQPVVIISRPKNNEVRMPVTPRIIIKKPATFSYQDSRRVPWNYECNTTVPGKETTKDQGVSANPEPVKGRAITVEQKIAEPVLSINKLVKEEEAVEFLKFLKHSEYNVVEQLHKQPARIFVLALLLNSEAHRCALMKVLNETYVANDISVVKLDRLVNNISADNFIFFNDDEIPPGGMGSTKALHITTRCKGYTFPGVLIDNGSALNMLPLSTLNRLSIDSSHMKTCLNIVTTFDGIERKVMGRIEIPLLIGPTVYEVDFLVMDIKPSYNCLLGRPWIHSVGAVPSSLHHKLKLVSEGRLVTINAEEDIIAAVSNEAPYVETNDEARRVCNCWWGKGVLPRRGLGKYLQGKIAVPALKEKQDNFSLGYKPDREQRRKELERRQERRRARLNREEIKWEPMIIPHISKTFVSGGIIHFERRISIKESIEETLENMHINAVCEGTKEEGSLLGICPYEPGSVLDNWTAEKIPEVFRTISEYYSEQTCCFNLEIIRTLLWK